MIKVNDKVKVRGDLTINKVYGGQLLVDEMEMFKGEMVTITEVVDEDNFKIKEDYAEFIWSKDMFEEVELEPMKDSISKEEIEAGMLVELYNRELELTVLSLVANTKDGKVLMSNGSYITLDTFDDELNYDIDEIIIMKVYGFPLNPINVFEYTTDGRDLLWKREIINWEEVEVDAKVLVRDFKHRKWEKRHFAKYENGKIFTYRRGMTSWTAEESELMSWAYGKLPK